MPSLKDLAKKNPSQLGDPVSLKAETSDNEPTDQDRPSKSSSSSGHAAKDATKPQDSYASSSAPVMAPAPTEQDIDSGSGGGKDETLREKATKKLHGDGANPSQLGDPVSLKGETSTTEPTDQDRGAKGTRSSKL